MAGGSVSYQIRMANAEGSAALILIGGRGVRLGRARRHMLARTSPRTCATRSCRRLTARPERMGFDELIDPRETRDALLALIRGLSSRQAAAEPASRTVIMP
jgi:hypothetical protein